MHQHPRAPPVTASPARSEATNPERTNNQRDWTEPRNSVAEVNRLNQVIQNFHTKAALIILCSRFDLAPAYAKGARRLNKWFNVELDETEEYRDEIRPWKTCDIENRPPPLVIEVYLETDLTPKQTLVLLDQGKRCDVEGEVVLERWTIELGETAEELPSDLNVILPLVYKKSIVLFRSLYTYAAFLPAWKFGRTLKKQQSPLKLAYRIGSDSRSDRLSDDAGRYSFGVTDSPAGPFSVRVQYRENCEFRVDDSESILSSRFMGADEDLFRPSLESKADHPVGSLPTKSRIDVPPDLGQAYGSMSTFHQAGAGTSPITALRHAQDIDSANNSPSPKPQSSRDGRRPSFSFHPFKTPVLSASPSLARPSSRALETLREGKDMPPPAVPAKPERPPTRYSSSFSHRRARLSREEDSSGKTSAASSANRSGVIEAVEDDENISDFIKMLESKRDLLTPADATAAEVSSRRTTAALNRFSRMRDSNTALSESMSLSLHRSSTSSRQLSSVPPMVGNSVSTSSSAGKPISPHTPHTPAIPSRLSANSIVDYHEGMSEPASEIHSQEAPSDETAETQRPPIDIPTSPRLLASYRRSSSVVQRRDQTEYGQRSASMGARPAEAREESVPEKSEQNKSGQDRSGKLEDKEPAEGSNLYRSRLARGGQGRGGSDSGGSGSLERRRPGRSSFSRPDGRTDDDEVFLPFAMSDIHTSRLSLEEARMSGIESHGEGAAVQESILRGILRPAGR